jgi:hypothetical protein
MVVETFLETLHAVHLETDGDQCRKVSLPHHPLNPHLRPAMIDSKVTDDKGLVLKLTDLGELRTLQIG